MDAVTAKHVRGASSLQLDDSTRKMGSIQVWLDTQRDIVHTRPDQQHAHQHLPTCAEPVYTGSAHVQGTSRNRKATHTPLLAEAAAAAAPWQFPAHPQVLPQPSLQSVLKISNTSRRIDEVTLHTAMGCCTKGGACRMHSEGGHAPLLAAFVAAAAAAAAENNSRTTVSDPKRMSSACTPWMQTSCTRKQLHGGVKRGGRNMNVYVYTRQSRCSKRCPSEPTSSIPIMIYLRKQSLRARDTMATQEGAPLLVAAAAAAPPVSENTGGLGTLQCH